MKTLVKIFGASLLASLPLTANAGIISYGEFSKGEHSEIVTGLGMDWMQWTSTKGMSINSALAAFSHDGWRVASVAEVTELFNYFIPALSWVESESVSQQGSTGWTDELSPVSELDVQFQTLFGYTTVGSASDYLDGDRLEKTEAIFGSDDNGNGRYGLAGMYDDFTVFNGNQNTGNAYINKDTFARSFAYRKYGVALVRGDLDLSYRDGNYSFEGGEQDIGGEGGESVNVKGEGTSAENNSDVVSVPEPTTIGIFALASGFLFARRKSR